MRATPTSRATSITTRPSPLKASPKQNGEDIYSMDLGTMGIPREVAQQNQQNNFLFNSGSALGPGEYQPQPEKVLPKVPAASFGKLPGN